MATIVLEVPGQPVPQPRARVTTRGGHGHAYTPAAHPIHAYRRAIVLVARSSGIEKFEGAARLEIDAVFARPPSHWRKHDLRPYAPRWPRGDGDNLQKAVADALTDAGIWRDDDQVVEWFCRKRFAGRSEPARTLIRISPVEV